MEFTIARVGSYAAALIGSADASRTTCLINHRGARHGSRRALQKEAGRLKSARNRGFLLTKPTNRPRFDENPNQFLRNCLSNRLPLFYRADSQFVSAETAIPRQNRRLLRRWVR